MQLIENQIAASNKKAFDTLPRNTENDAQELIRHNITNTMIQTSEFARDANDEVCILMFATDTPYYIPLYSREISAVIHWIGLIYGVKLEVNDINKVIGDLQHYIVVESGNAEFMEETFQSMGVCQ